MRQHKQFGSFSPLGEWISVLSVQHLTNLHHKLSDIHPFAVHRFRKDLALDDVLLRLQGCEEKIMENDGCSSNEILHIREAKLSQ